MDQQDRSLWDGGQWERQNPSYPVPPPVKVPPPGAGRQGKKPKKRRRARRSFLLFLGLILSLTALAALIRQGLEGQHLPSIDRYFRGEGDFYQSEPAVEPSVAKAATGTGVILTLEPLGEAQLSNQEIYEKNLPSIVFIETKGPEAGSGSGILFTDDGYIITNAHVVSAATAIRVVLWDDAAYQAKLVGWNAREDLAVLKIDAEDLSPAEFGNSAQLRVGDDAFAMGNPLGQEYRASFTDGMISALDRYVAVDDVHMNLIQTTAAINFGNSGGALLNRQGQVVGITTIKIMSSEGTIEAMGFAIPSIRVKQIADRLIAGEEILSPALGITVRPTELPPGLRVESVQPHSDAQAQGLQKGDVILTAGGREIRRNSELARVIAGYMVGEILPLTVARGEETLALEILLMDQALFSAD